MQQADLDPAVATACRDLAQELRSHELFRKHRGMLLKQGVLGHLLEGFAAHAESPTACLKEFDGYMAEMRVLANLLAKAKRDHSPAVLKELGRALRLDCLMPGEELPNDETEEYTLVMPGELATFKMMECVVSGRYGQVRDPRHGAYRGVENPEALVKRMVKALGLRQYFPSLDKTVGKLMRHGCYFGWELNEAWRLDVHAKFLRRCAGLDRSEWQYLTPRRAFRPRDTEPENVPVDEEIPDYARPGFAELNLTESKQGEYSRHLLEEPTLYLVRGDGSDVAACFKGCRRADRPGLWNFRVRKGTQIRDIGLHASWNHAVLKELWPHFASLDSDRFGTIILNQDHMDEKRYLSKDVPWADGMAFVLETGARQIAYRKAERQRNLERLARSTGRSVAELAEEYKDR